MAATQRNGTGVSAEFAETNGNVPASGTDIVNKTYADAIAAAAAAAEALDVRLDGSRVMTGALDMGTHAINNITDPVSAQQAATKAYVDAVAQGLSTKPSARAATTGALPTYAYLNGALGVGATLTKTVPFAALPAQDGITLVVNDRVLIKDEAGGNAPYNGIYVVTAVGSGVAPWILTRALDCDQASDFVGAFVFIEEGTVNAGSGWVQTTPAPITVGVSNIVWTQFSGAGEITAGNGLTKSGNTLSVLPDGTTLSVSGAGVKVAAGGITPTELASDSVTTVKILNSNVTNAKLANMADQTIKGNISGGAAPPSDLTIAQIASALAATIVSSGASPITAAVGQVILVTSSDGADVVVNLPTAVGNAGKQITIKKVDLTDGTVTVTGNGGQLIDIANTFVLRRPLDPVTVISDGAQWWVI